MPADRGQKAFGMGDKIRQARAHPPGDGGVRAAHASQHRQLQPLGRGRIFKPVEIQKRRNKRGRQTVEPGGRIVGVRPQAHGHIGRT